MFNNYNTKIKHEHPLFNQELLIILTNKKYLKTKPRKTNY